ncbi:MAG: hypothetical protein L6V91_05645 [Bacilli bacterium]|nr:MAG: hypothetical protein L6V91_05645 [Bacilli bacterium]
MAKEFKSTNELIEILNSKRCIYKKMKNNVKYLIEKVFLLFNSKLL